MTSATQTPQWSRVGRTHTDKQDRPPEMRPPRAACRAGPAARTRRGREAGR